MRWRKLLGKSRSPHIRICRYVTWNWTKTRPASINAKKSSTSNPTVSRLCIESLRPTWTWSSIMRQRLTWKEDLQLIRLRSKFKRLWRKLRQPRTQSNRLKSLSLIWKHCWLLFCTGPCWSLTLFWQRFLEGHRKNVRRKELSEG